MSDVEDNLVTVGANNQGSRKRQSKGSQRDARKIKKYLQPKGYNIFNPCQHNNKHFQCKKFTPNCCKYLRNKLLVPDKVAQDNYISNFITVIPVKRRRPLATSINNRPNSVSLKYHLINYNNKKIPVCKKLFMQVMLVKPTRLRNIFQAKSKGQHISEKRGGDRKSHKNAAKRLAVTDFIKKLKGKESHYSRNKSKRIYLSENLNINKLCKLYNDSQENASLKVPKYLFRREFCKFNIGFRSPASDVCSLCLKLKHVIKSTEDEQTKIQYLTQKRIHKLRANAFYKIMKEDLHAGIKLCFDLQQIQCLPKSPIQEAYYSRQFGFYSLCIVDLPESKPTFYVWTEDQAGKGAVEVSSALLNHLKNLQLDFSTKNLMLFCDGCGSQNKNNYILNTLMYYLLQSESGLENIQITFPVRGHSFLPADRVFGRVEQLLRKKPLIIEKEEYFDIYRSVGNVMILGNDWFLYDTKSLSSKEGCYRRLKGISEMKRILINKSTVMSQRTNRMIPTLKVKGLQNFQFESEQEDWQILRKKGWSLQKCKALELTMLPLVHNIKDDKKKDVNKLLELMFGEDWRNDLRLKWYADVIDNSFPLANNEELTVDQAETECICLDEDCGLHI